MTSESSTKPWDLVETHPALGIFRLAALSAGPGGKLDDHTLDLMFEQVESGALDKAAPELVWPELERGLMAQTPSHMFLALYGCGALHIILPEVAAVFGVPQIADDPPEVDIGQHLLRVLDEAARCEAPLPVRFAALVMHVGKSDSPREHLPVHYRHVERGVPRIEALCERFGVGPDCRALALLALAECERVHRVSQVRAGPVAELLERAGAFSESERFQQLLVLCTCDYRAYGRRPTQDYPKAALLHAALKACADISIPAEGGGDEAAHLREARAMAIATAFRSERWSD